MQLASEQTRPLYNKLITAVHRKDKTGTFTTTGTNNTVE